MTSLSTRALLVGLFATALVGGCTQTRYVVVERGSLSTASMPAAAPQVTPSLRVQPIYCVEAPVGYVVPQDKWDPYTIPCPPRTVAASVRTAGTGAKTPAGEPGKPTPTPPQPAPQPTATPKKEVAKAGNVEASRITKEDGTIDEGSKTSGSSSECTGC